MEFLEYILKIHREIFFFSCEHIFLSFMSIIMAVVIGIPMGIVITYYQKARKTILGATNVIQAVPSMALFGFLIPLIGIGKLPTIIIVVLYSLLPIVKNTYIGLDGINPLTIEAAEGIGMTKFQILQKVQLPLALPVIMGGVRIAVVTSVGLMTIAAFVGAGGLGYLVFSGIRTINNYQILAGAIPACILALLIDYLTGVLEKAVIPTGIQLNKKRSIFNNRKKKRILAVAMFVGIFLTVIFSGMVTMYKPSSEKVIVMGSKEFTEGEILANVMAVMIEEKTDISVDRRFALGGTQICFNALKSKEIDMYVDYTGTVYGDTLKYPPIQDMEEVYNTVKKDMKEKYDIEVLQQLGFNNTYALAVRKDTAEKYNLKTISDLEKAARNLTLSASLEFLNREDCFVGLNKKYKLDFRKIIGIDGSSKYLALTNKESDVIDVYTTDALLQKLDLVVLEDDRHFFPPYYAVPLVREETIEKYPEIVPIIEELQNVLNDTVISSLNYKVENLGKKPKEAALEFIEEYNLLK